MLRTRLVTLLFGCLLLASASWADNLGYVDCSKYPENTQVLDKAGKTSGAVAFLPCGERFTILVRGEFFTQIQTKDGKVGYLNTYLISYDSPAAPKPQPSPAQTPAPASNAVAQSAASSKFKIIATTSSAPTPSAPAPASPAQASNVPAAPTAAAAQPSPSAPAPAQANASASNAPSAQPQPAAPAQPASAYSAAAPPAPVTETKSVAQQVEVQPSSSALSAPVGQSEPSVPATQPAPSAPNVQPQTTASSQPAPVASAPAPSPAAAQPEATAPAPVEVPPSVPTTSTPATQPTSSAPAAQPEPPMAAQPQPEPIHPNVEAPQVMPARPPRNPSPFPNVSTVPVMELFAGYGFTRFGGGNGTNLNGALGSFGWNFKPWLQIIGDASYNFVTVSGTKSVLYGDHFGPRIYLRARGARGPIPFVEGLVGGSRVDTTAAGVTTSKNGLTYKAGGGIDLAISRHISVRAIEADYYRVPFLTASQTNYVASAGIIFRFGGRPRY